MDYSSKCHVTWQRPDGICERETVINKFPHINNVMYITASLYKSSVSFHGTLPVAVNGRVEKITVSGWIRWPSPPSSTVKVLYVVPNILGL